VETWLQQLPFWGPAKIVCLPSMAPEHGPFLQCGRFRPFRPDLFVFYQPQWYHPSRNRDKKLRVNVKTGVPTAACFRRGRFFGCKAVLLPRPSIGGFPASVSPGWATPVTFYVHSLPIPAVTTSSNNLLALSLNSVFHGGYFCHSLALPEPGRLPPPAWATAVRQGFPARGCRATTIATETINRSMAVTPKILV